MTKTNDRRKPEALSADEFYEELAGEYDSMTGFGRRFVQEKPFFSFLVKRYGITTALDAGTGTGFHALLLSQLGVAVTAADISAAMLRRLRHHAEEFGVAVEAVQSDLTELPRMVSKKFDAVFCLGNTLPHFLSAEKVGDVLRSFRELLHPRGVLFLQMLNYERILGKRERVQNVKEIGGVTFVRFYDYLDPCVRFNVLRIESNNGSPVHKLTSTLLRPIVRSELAPQLLRAGFPTMEVYGSIALDDFVPGESRDLVVIAHGGEDGRALR